MNKKSILTLAMLLVAFKSVSVFAYDNVSSSSCSDAYECQQVEDSFDVGDENRDDSYSFASSIDEELASRRAERKRMRGRKIHPCADGWASDAQRLKCARRYKICRGYMTMGQRLRCIKNSTIKR